MSLMIRTVSSSCVLSSGLSSCIPPPSVVAAVAAVAKEDATTTATLRQCVTAARHAHNSGCYPQCCDMLTCSHARHAHNSGCYPQCGEQGLGSPGVR